MVVAQMLTQRDGWIVAGSLRIDVMVLGNWAPSGEMCPAPRGIGQSAKPSRRLVGLRAIGSRRVSYRAPPDNPCWTLQEGAPPPLHSEVVEFFHPATPIDSALILECSIA